ncbi:BspA family leucine-rich repeat surface protein [Campylobacter sp. US33a]|uniref:BspA family leucine-rich repeat surface protein n=1 Tax=Campylobacter sp. US33a TaxID=2498120 RepID=UPI001068B376|nr:BspA family leucine-rich repeat surface protein [Campylobacter sp. US33a]TEY00702.1 BspA family leucine-rich repeat surface protein [Campylobacter sp. US33a]
MIERYTPQTKEELKALVKDESINLGDIDTSNITDMSGLFLDSTRKDFSGIESWDTSNVEDMSHMFSFASFFNQDISQWNITNVKYMNRMFDNAISFNQNISSWDVENKFTAWMFEECSIDFRNKAKNFERKYIPIDLENLKKLVDDPNINLGDIDTSNITDMSFLFKNSTRKDFSGIESWDVSKVESMAFMFLGCKFFNQDISGWDVSKVESMAHMFENAISFNQDIGSWNTSNAENMRAMFLNAISFNQDIGSWDVFNVKDMSEMFKGCIEFNQSLNDFKVDNVENMRSMFENAINFNQPLNKWNTSNVKDMYHMFDNAKSFNQDISGWDMSRVSDSEGAFDNCVIKMDFVPLLFFNKENKNDRNDNTVDNSSDSKSLFFEALQNLKSDNLNLNSISEFYNQHKQSLDVGIVNDIESKTKVFISEIYELLYNSVNVSNDKKEAMHISLK